LDQQTHFVLVGSLATAARNSSCLLLLAVMVLALELAVSAVRVVLVGALLGA
jgi:hypothetical protein